MIGKKTVWHLDELVYLKKEFHRHTCPELLEHINANRPVPVTKTVLRNKCAELGLKKNERPIPWNDREVSFLLNNFRKMGNIEIADRLNRYKSRTRNFNKKNIEKKIKLLRIKRSAEDLKRIKDDHIKRGMHNRPRYKEDHHKYRPEGSKWIRRHGRNKFWFIKKDGKIHFLHRYLYEKHIGPLKKGQCVSFKDGNTLNCDIENLYQCKRGKHGHLFREQKEYSGYDPFLEKDKPKSQNHVPREYSIPKQTQTVDH